MKLKDNSTKEIDTALYQLEQKLNSKISNIKFPEQEVYDDKDIRTALEEEITNRKTAIKSEADTRKSTDDTLQQLIGTETEARETADKTISDNLADEITNRTDADKTLQDNIDKKQNTLTAGDNITITNDTISATDTTYTATSPITLSGTDIQLDTVSVEKGGTGKTTAKTAFMNLAEGLSENSGPLDTECIIYRNTDGSNWGRYTLSTFWSWIKGKIENVFDTLIAHPSDTDNPHAVTKTQVGLGNCDNTADSDKNVNSALYISRTNSTAPSSNTLIKFAGSTDGYTMSAELTNGDDLEIRNKLIDDVTTKETWYGNTTKLMTLQPTGSGTSITGADLTLHNGTITATKFSGPLSGNATSSSSCSGNSATATKLATARSISITDGTNTGTASSFDGSGDISLSLPSTINVNSASASSLKYTSANSGADTTYTISTFMEKLVSLGFITKNVYYNKNLKLTWAYANNGTLSTSYGDIKLAGCNILFSGCYSVDPTTSSENSNYFDIIFMCNPASNPLGLATTIKYTCRSGSQYSPKWVLYNSPYRTVIPTSTPSTLSNGDIWLG
jgi:hypothetical protein